MLRAFRVAGASPELWHLDALLADPARLDDFDLFGFPGGFSYGDDIASGRIFAMKVRQGLYPALRRALQRGCPMIGACNGFQTLVQVGLLPGPSPSAAPSEPNWPEQPPAQTLSLIDNQDARFHDRWVGMDYVRDSRCIWTKGLHERFAHLGLHASTLAHVLPVAHGEGRLVASDASAFDALERHGQVVARYSDNYNGSTRAIAGVCDASGLVFGLMPHPERFLDWNRHPAWTRVDPRMLKGPTPGEVMFRNAVAAAARQPIGA
jgi:phosphoribosylformylglycinamidine synthase